MKNTKMRFTSLYPAMIEVRIRMSEAKAEERKQLAKQKREEAKDGRK